MGTNIAEVVSATNRNIRHVIADKDTTKNAIAVRAGIPSTTFARKLRDSGGGFTLRELGQIAEALDLELSEILPQNLIKTPVAA